ncbi:MAG TPA: hypothetical protein VIJ12_01310 [Candidatus Baltobacteraceae bacterium]
MQIASAALLSASASPGSFPARLSPELGVRIYRRLARIAPAPYVETMLANYDLQHGDVAAALRESVALPSSPMRNELLARIADRSGDRALALEYFLVAPDVSAIAQEVDRVQRVDPMAAFDLERRLADRLNALTTHPDAVADAYWRLGQLLTLASYRPGQDARALRLRAMNHYLRAIDLAPLSERYLLAAGSQALLLNDPARARRFFLRGVDVDPTSADAYAGLGIVALIAGDTTQARAFAARAYALDPNAHILGDLQRQLR